MDSLWQTSRWHWWGQHTDDDVQVCVRLNNITFTGIPISVSGIWTNFVKGPDWLSFQDGCQMLIKDEKKRNLLYIVCQTL